MKRIALALLLGLAPVAALAQDAPAPEKQRPAEPAEQAPKRAETPTKSSRLERAAERYASAQWPAASALRAGWAPSSLQVEGYQVRTDLDARRASATLRFTDKKELAQRAEPEARVRDAVLVQVRRFETSKAARQWLLKSLSATQAALRPLNLSDVAFGARAGEAPGSPGERLVYSVGVRANLGWIVRSTNRLVDSAPFAMALDASLAKAPLSTEPSAAPLRFLAADVAPAKAGTPLRFQLRWSAAPASLAFDVPPGASVLKVKGGYALYSESATPVEVSVFAMSKDLQSATARLVLTPSK